MKEHLPTSVREGKPQKWNGNLKKQDKSVRAASFDDLDLGNWEKFLTVA